MYYNIYICTYIHIYTYIYMHTHWCKHTDTIEVQKPGPWLHVGQSMLKTVLAQKYDASCLIGTFGGSAMNPKPCRA